MTNTYKWGTAVGIALCLSCYCARAEDAPKDNVGFSTMTTQVVDLGDEIEGMSGRQLRLRVLKIEDRTATSASIAIRTDHRWFISCKGLTPLHRLMVHPKLSIPATRQLRPRTQLIGTRTTARSQSC